MFRRFLKQLQEFSNSENIGNKYCLQSYLHLEKAVSPRRLFSFAITYRKRAGGTFSLISQHTKRAESGRSLVSEVNLKLTAKQKELSMAVPFADDDMNYFSE